MTLTDTAPDRATGTGRAHGKVVLIGEHTVVYGMPAIAIPMSGLSAHATLRPPEADSPPPAPSAHRLGHDDALEVRFTCSVDTIPAGSGAAAATAAALRCWDPHGRPWEVRIRSDIPPARGLGSSAAAAAASVRAVADLCGAALDERSLYRLVQTGEKVTHGRPSGVDAAAVTATGPIRFAAGIARPIPTRVNAGLVVADTGESGSTRQAVDSVRARLQHDHANARRLLTRAAELAEGAAADLADGDASGLGVRLTEFQRLLRELGISTTELDRLIAAALKAGACGAKLTGGGLGGCVLALVEPHRTAAVREALTAAGAHRTWTMPMTQET
ncbi:mevalonate kinase [Nocardia wallacei]|uniref:mevalonate kinase n=1 Tax=Nocardia wallacei TaxID=480035 RepID=UPI0024577AA6|nr:mevalonate kinase [Nocardia wallacei]